MPIFARILDEKYIKTFFMINPIVKTIELPDGRTITLETGKLAKTGRRFCNAPHG